MNYQLHFWHPFHFFLLVAKVSHYIWQSSLRSWDPSFMARRRKFHLQITHIHKIFNAIFLFFKISHVMEWTPLFLIDFLMHLLNPIFFVLAKWHQMLHEWIHNECVMKLLIYYTYSNLICVHAIPFVHSYYKYQY